MITKLLIATILGVEPQPSPTSSQELSVEFCDPVYKYSHG